MIVVIRKIIAYVIFYLLWPNLCFLLFTKDIYSDPFYFTGLLIWYFVSFVDLMIRPLDNGMKRNVTDKYDVIMSLLILSSPLWFVAYIYEYNLLLLDFLDPVVSIIGLILLILGSIILLSSRYQLGRFAGGNLKIQEEHRLKASGLYKFSRNPLYFGGIVAALGMGLVFRSLFVISFGIILDTIVFLQRIFREEELLIEEFGDEFLEYKESTKRLIPFIY